MQQTAITNDELIQKLRESHLESYQKNELIRHVSRMSDTEKSETLKLIEQGQEVKAIEEKAIASHQDELQALNDEFGQQVRTLEHEVAEKARKEFEQLENKDEESELESIETELQNL